jgi:hypothetical protein
MKIDAVLREQFPKHLKVLMENLARLDSHSELVPTDRVIRQQPDVDLLPLPLKPAPVSLTHIAPTPSASGGLGRNAGRPKLMCIACNI